MISHLGPAGEANFTYIRQELDHVYSRYAQSKREVKGNKLSRKGPSKAIRNNEMIVGDMGRFENWYAVVKIGTPPQEVELDLDMLSSDFFVYTTTSDQGSRYDDFFSSSTTKSLQHLSSSCTTPSEIFLMSGGNSADVEFAYCRPSKASLQTLDASGGVLGLAPSRDLAQLKFSSLIQQLSEKRSIASPSFAITLFGADEGVLSLGGAISEAVASVDSETEAKLARLNYNLDNEKEGRLEARVDKPDNSDSPFRWNEIHGAEGWWQILMPGIWVGGRKVVKHQPIVLDINTPFIVAPPSAATTLYASIPGAYALDPPHRGLYAYPCLNSPPLAFEFDAWNFPAFRGAKGHDDLGEGLAGRTGGFFSLGRLQPGNGFCVGKVVGLELDTAVGKENIRGSGSVGEEEAILRSKGAKYKDKAVTVEGNGMKGVWILGEPWFRGTTALFDMQKKEVGFRTT